MIVKELLLKKVVEKLRLGLTEILSPERSIRIMTDEDAPPNAGDEFIGIYGGASSNLLAPKEITKRFEHTLKIGITRRFLGTFNETAGGVIITDEQLTRTKPSMLARAQQIANLIEDSPWTLFAGINTELETEDGGCFISPLGLISSNDAVQKVTPEHWGIETVSNSGNPQVCGLLLEMDFGGAVYIHNRQVA